MILGFPCSKAIPQITPPTLKGGGQLNDRNLEGASSVSRAC